MGSSVVYLGPLLAVVLALLTALAAAGGRLSGLGQPLDQIRTVGLVTLPGAFVGVLLGGGSPLAAGAAQLLVLVGLLATEVAAVWAVTELVARSRVLPGLPR